MALKLVSGKREYLIRSSDEKPTIDVPDGSTIHAVDTGEQWVFFENSWEKDRRNDPVY